MTTPTSHPQRKRKEAKVPKALWVVMRAHSWSSVTFAGIECPTPKEGPHRWLPVFDSKEAAIEWHGSEADIIQLTTAK